MIEYFATLIFKEKNNKSWIKIGLKGELADFWKHIAVPSDHIKK